MARSLRLLGNSNFGKGESGSTSLSRGGEAVRSGSVVEGTVGIVGSPSKSDKEVSIASDWSDS